jgi:hypothetical protein
MVSRNPGTRELELPGGVAQWGAHTFMAKNGEPTAK